MNDSEERPNGHGCQEPQTGTEDGNAFLQVGPGYKTEPGLSMTLSHIQAASKPTTRFVPTTPTASHSSLQPTSSLIGRAESSLADAASHLQHRAPSAPSTTPGLVRPSPKSKAIEQETHTSIASQKPACSSTQPLAASSQSTENRTRPLSTPPLATLGSMQIHPPHHNQTAGSLAKLEPSPQQVADTSKNGHLPAGSQKAQYQSNIPTAPGHILPVAMHRNPAQGNRTAGLQSQPENTAQLVSPLAGKQKTQKPNQDTEFHYQATTATTRPRTSSGQARMNAAKVPRGTNSHIFQRENSQRHGFTSLTPDQEANYYHDKTRDRQLPDRGPTENRSNCWGHDPKGKSNLILNILLWC